MDQHCFWKLDPYPHWREKLDPDLDPYLNQNSGVLEAQNGALEGRERSQWRRGGQIWSPGGSIDLADSQTFDVNQYPDPDPH
jgi:hypothetical protein